MNASDGYIKTDGLGWMDPDGWIRMDGFGWMDPNGWIRTDGSGWMDPVGMLRIDAEGSMRRLWGVYDEPLGIYAQSLGPRLIVGEFYVEGFMRIR